MNIMYCSAEVEPYAKSGGLGDVIGALPKAVATSNNVCVVMPYYKALIAEKYQQSMRFNGYFYTDVAWRHQYVGVYSLQQDNVTYYFIDNEFYFAHELYNFADNERFAFFAKAVLDMCGWLDFKPDVIHCNDWSTGLIPVLYDYYYRSQPFYANIKFVYTIHNLRYQGKMGVAQLQDLTGLPDYYFTADRLLHGDCANVMKGAMVFSQAVTTVSNTYADEITTSYYGEGLDGVTSYYRNKTVGILNGVDYNVYNPATDSLIDYNYNLRNYKTGKAKNKLSLQKQLGLPVREDVPVIALISRLVDQKGLDLVDCVIDELLQSDVQLVVVGTGEGRYEDLFRRVARNYPNKVSANILFNNTLAHKVYASADFVLVPSAFEPCGLTQLIGLKYGAIPIVRETGGLKDTVTSYNEYDGTGNGFSFADYNAHDMLYTVRRAVDYYYNKREVLENIRKMGMKCDYSWAVSSNKYVELYNNVCNTADNVKHVDIDKEQKHRKRTTKKK